MNFQESETVELKSIVVDDIKKEIIAFANCEGGILYIGVQDDGTVLGVDDPDETALRISNMVRDAIKPDLTMFLHYETIDVDEKKDCCGFRTTGNRAPLLYCEKRTSPRGCLCSARIFIGACNEYGDPIHDQRNRWRSF